MIEGRARVFPRRHACVGDGDAPPLGQRGEQGGGDGRRRPRLGHGPKIDEYEVVVPVFQAGRQPREFLQRAAMGLLGGVASAIGSFFLN